MMRISSNKLVTLTRGCFDVGSMFYDLSDFASIEWEGDIL